MCLDSAGTYAYYPYFMRRQLLRHAFHQHHYATLTGCIVYVTTPWNYFVYAAHANNLPCGLAPAFHNAPANKLPGGFACAKELPCKVNADNGIPLLQRHVYKFRIALQARIVYKNINGSVLLKGFGKHGLYVSFVAYIGVDSIGMPACGCNLVDRLFSDVVRVHVINYHVCSRGR